MEVGLWIFITLYCDMLDVINFVKQKIRNKKKERKNGI